MRKGRFHHRPPNAQEDAHRSGIIKRISICVVLALVWGAPLLLAAELYARFRYNAAVPKITEMERVQWAEFTDEEMEVLPRYGQEPFDMLHPRGRFKEMTEQERRAYVEEWDEAAFVCDEAGVIHEAYHTQEPEEVAQLTQSFAAGDSILPLFPQEYQEEAKKEIRKSATETYGNWVTKAIVLANGEEHQFKIFFEPMASEEGAGSGTGIFVRRYIFKREFREYYPNARELTTQHFSTNSLGWRDGPLVVPKPATQYRIVCVGGSTTVEGPTDKLTYPHMLECKLREAFPGRDIEVVNCGIYGLDAAGERDRLADYLALEPDLILYYSFGNDLAYDVPLWFIGEGWLHTPRRSLKWGLRKSRFIGDYFNWWHLPDESVLRKLYEDVSLASAGQLVKAAREQGVAVALSSIAYPDPEALTPLEHVFMDYQVARFIWEGQVNYDSFVHLVTIYNQMLEDVAREEGVHFLPTAQTFKGGMECFYDPFHMTLTGIERKAETLCQLLSQEILCDWAQGSGATGPKEDPNE